MELYIVVNREEFNIEFLGNSQTICEYISSLSNSKIYVFGNPDEVAADFNAENSYLRCYKYEGDSLSFLADNFSASELRAAADAKEDEEEGENDETTR